MTKSIDNGEPFNEAAYREKLIAMGSDPQQAAAVAAKMAAARAAGEGQGKPSRRKAAQQPTPDLFSQPTAAEASQLAKTTAATAKPAKGVSDTARTPSTRAATKQENELVAASAAIMGQSPTGNDFAFMHAVMCQVGLPRAKVDGENFMRRSGAAWVNVQAGFLDEGHGPVLQPIPYGPMPRLALSWVSTYAKRHGAREIPIGDSAAGFLRLMDMDTQGARYLTLRKQMNALAACRLQLGYKGRTYNGQPVEQFDAWLSNRETGQRSLWPGVMVLSEHYFRELVDNAVPLDNRALHALKGSALSLDVYAWLAHRLHRIEGRPVILYWTNLREQFGQEYQGKNADKDFKKKFLVALRAVLAVYPQAQVKQVTGGLLLMASPPPIPYKGQ